MVYFCTDYIIILLMEDVKKTFEPVLETDNTGVYLTDGSLSMRGNLTSMIPRLKPQNLNGELIVKAAKLKNCEGTPVLLDATAGMGEDSLLLAASGFQVKLYEYDRIIAALLRDSLRLAADVPELSDAVSRMELFEEDSIYAMEHLSYVPDVILLDPMFPERQKSGLIKKKFQLLQQLEKPCPDEAALFDAAAGLHPKKIVVKRPQKGPLLAGKKPSYSLTGKSIRYDCYLLP